MIKITMQTMVILFSVASQCFSMDLALSQRNETEYERCVICQEKIEPDLNTIRNIITTPCQHMFHKACLNRWISQVNDCPVCRTKLARKGTVFCSNSCLRATMMIVLASGYMFYTAATLSQISPTEKRKDDEFYFFISWVTTTLVINRVVREPCFDSFLDSLERLASNQ